MQFRIADTFTDSLARLTGDEQKAAKTTAFDLQLNPAAPGHRFHKLDKARDKAFWSVRVNSDVRIIVHRSEQSLLLCYVDHHDKAYDWAERRKIEVHPTTGAAQLVEVRETVREIVVPVYVSADPAVPAPAPVRPPLADTSDEDLLRYGVPAEWIDDIRAAATEDQLLAVAARLPAEAGEAVLVLATGGVPPLPVAAPEAVDAFEHPDALRRFRVVTSVEELEQALEYPWDKWTIFLHPEQRELVERDYNGPARVAGTAGTGKTIVALHRAVHLARTQRESRVLLTTLSDALANALRVRLRRLLAAEPRLGERVDVYSLDAVASRLYRQAFGEARAASPVDVAALIRDSIKEVGDAAIGPAFAIAEWEHVVDAGQLDSWEAYRDVERLGRKTRLPEARRKALWHVYDRVRGALRDKGLVTRAEMYTRLAQALAADPKPRFDFVVADEAQDLSVSQLKFLAALGGGRPNALFFAGDLGQRIFQQPFSWRSLGVDVRGRASILRVNYRTSHQIRSQADRLLGPALADVDGIEEDRRGAVSAFNGPPPTLGLFESTEAEQDAVAAWIAERLADGVQAHEIGVFVRSEAELARVRAALEHAGAEFVILDDRIEAAHGKVAVSTMHLAKGLEFRAVVVMACDEDVIPLQARIESVGDESDLKEVYDTERHLLYVACTRARDRLFISGIAPGSEFLADLRSP